MAVLFIGQLRGYLQETDKKIHFLIDPLKRDFGQVRQGIAVLPLPSRAAACIWFSQPPSALVYVYRILITGVAHVPDARKWPVVPVQVDIYMCIDKPNGQRMKDKKIGGVAPVWVREYTSRTMFLRMSQCYTDVRNHAQQHGIRYDWWVRTRPDLIIYENVPTVAELAKGRTDTIFARSRRVGAGYHSVDNEAVSYW